MSVDILQVMEKAGELLVAQGYGYDSRLDSHGYFWIATDKEKSYKGEVVDPFDDTLEALHQLHALEDWFVDNNRNMLNEIAGKTNPKDSNHIRRRDAIFECIEIMADAEQRSLEMLQELKRRNGNVEV